jgi:hypothetical protein
MRNDLPYYRQSGRKAISLGAWFCRCNDIVLRGSSTIGHYKDYMYLSTLFGGRIKPKTVLPPSKRIERSYGEPLDGFMRVSGGRNGPSSEISLTPGAAAITSWIRLTMQAADVCTPSARSTRIFEAGRPSTVHIICSDSPGKRMRNSMCAVAVGPS